MEITSSERMQWRSGPSHRAGGVLFKDLFAGNPGPDNYWFTLVRIDAYAAPPHHHNFDQVRIMLEGRFGFGDEFQEEGTVGYFSEGLTYTQTSDGPNVHLLLQCEGGRAEPFISQDQLFAAVEALKQVGRFENGRFISEADGANRVQDGFEACWEHLNGRPVTYTTPRFQRPIIMVPNSFAYQRVAGAEGLERRFLGSFTERRLELGYWRLDAGRNATVPAADATSLLYVIGGEGAIEGDSTIPVAKGDAIRTAPGETLPLAAETTLELIALSLPKPLSA